MESWNARSLDAVRLVEILSCKNKLLEYMSEDEKEELKRKAHSAIQLCLADEIFLEVVDEDITVNLWFKLESLYMTKFLTNKIYLKHHLLTPSHEGRYTN